MIEDNLGIKMNVEQIAWSDFLNDMTAQRYQIFSAGWSGDYPDAQNFVDILFHSGSPQNHMGYSNAKVDKLLEQARVEADGAKRMTLYRQAERLIVDDAPWIPLTYGMAHVLVKPYVKGFEGNAAVYPWLKGIYLEK
jgi:oligopeptide transport system substrate-binding protein